MKNKVDNAVIMAAGTSSRFVPLCFERPKALIEVKGEILIERQIKQLQDSGIREIIVVVGYMKEEFEYLKEKFGVILVENDEYQTRNNNASLYVVRKYLHNTFICSSDNYFASNPFENEVDGAYYAGVFAEGKTKEWCMAENREGYIDSVTVGGEKSWYMLGHAFFDEAFSKRFVSILEQEYDSPQTADMYWENIFINHIDTLKMRIRKYPENYIFEFDTLDELREFDNSYKGNTRSETLKKICAQQAWNEEDIVEITSLKKSDNAATGFRFRHFDNNYEYEFLEESLRRIV